jgi:hypothetical protein
MISQMSQEYLHFFGPYSFNNENTSLFHSEFKYDEGIYIWVIKDIEHNTNYIHYIGETTCFAKRHREHLTNILGLNYYILDADSAKRGESVITWKGMWRDKSDDAAINVIEKYNSIAASVIKYVECIDVYFAPIKLPIDKRRHIEGSIAYNLRRKYPELTRFYTDDNHVGMNKEWFGEKIAITSDETIAGLDSEIEI